MGSCLNLGFKCIDLRSEFQGEITDLTLIDEKSFECEESRRALHGAEKPL